MIKKLTAVFAVVLLIGLLGAATLAADTGVRGQNLGAFTPLDEANYPAAAIEPDNSVLNISSATVDAKQYGQGGTMSIHFAGGVTGDGKMVSCAILDSAGSAVYYAPLSRSLGSGMATIQLPQDILPGAYTLTVFNEQLTGDGAKTSEPVTVQFEVLARPTIVSAITALNDSRAGEATVTITFSHAMDTGRAGDVFVGTQRVKPTAASWTSDTVYTVKYESIHGTTNDVSVKGFYDTLGLESYERQYVPQARITEQRLFEISFHPDSTGTGQVYYSINGGARVYTREAVVLTLQNGDNIAFGFTPDDGSAYYGVDYSLGFTNFDYEGYDYTLSGIHTNSQIRVRFVKNSYEFENLLGTFTGGEQIQGVFNASYDDFKYVKVNGVYVDSEYVTVERGTQKITLSSEFLNTMADGNYVMEAVFGSIYDGQVASGQFNITRNVAPQPQAAPAPIATTIPPTGDSPALLVYTALLGAGITVAILLRKRLKKQNESK